MTVAGNIRWGGEVLGVQPRIRLLRSYDERNHNYMGYVLYVRGEAAGEAREFTVGVGPGAQAKHAFCAGDRVGGLALPVADARIEPVEFYKVSALELTSRAGATPPPAPPWLGVPPALPAYRARGHRRLDVRTFEAKCRNCIWGARMPVELMADNWKPRELTYRFETFCYGPKSCALYRAGPTRKAPGRGGAGHGYEEEDSVDEEATAHRGLDE
ncbi:MAG: hypothetical protein NT115_18040 [Proteobacteria bacterium]|nr:hypothetical protein [Pseudomonadota bacterium]